MASGAEGAGLDWEIARRTLFDDIKLWCTMGGALRYPKIGELNHMVIALLPVTYRVFWI